jgi:Co/Zn/Cd efflux system component
VLSGRLQIVLAIWVLLDVLRRTAFGSEPISALMVGIGALALLANLLCLVLVRRHRAGGVHMRASVIFSSNDTLANLGVIAAGLLVLQGGRRILREARASRV